MTPAGMVGLELTMDFRILAAELGGNDLKPYA
jgi:hypothetical protein